MSARATPERASLLLPPDSVTLLRSLLCTRVLRSCKIYGFTLLVSLWLGLGVGAPLASAQQAGSVDAAFSPGYGVDGNVNALAVQPDGKMLVGGEFDHVNGVFYDNLARLNPDGSLDPGFIPPAINGIYSFVTVEVLALAVQSDGRILVGGTFTQVGGKAQNYLARLNPDGSTDTSFAPVFALQNGVTRANTAGVYAVAVQPDGRIVAVGSFDLVDGQPHRGVVRLNADGSLDATFDPAVPAHVYPAQGLDSDAFMLVLGPTGEVYVAGAFQTINGVSQPALARLHGSDGSLDTDFVPAIGKTSPAVTALACQADGGLLVAGYFVQPADKTASFRGDLARLNVDGSADVAFSRLHGNDGTKSSSIQSIAVQPQDGSILVAGGYVYLSGQSVGAVGRYLADGSPDKSFYPGLDPLATYGTAPGVTAVAVGANGTVLVGGTFDTVDGQFRHHLAGLLGSPAASCPVVSVRAAVPLVVAGDGGGSATQDGKLILTVPTSTTTALNVNYSASGQGTSWVATGTLSGGMLTIPAGARKGKLRVAPASYASYGVGDGKNIRFQVEAGRGYVPGTSNAAKLRIVAGAE